MTKITSLSEMNVNNRAFYDSASKPKAKDEWSPEAREAAAEARRRGSSSQSETTKKKNEAQKAGKGYSYNKRGEKVRVEIPVDD